uniref:Transmembrane protein n=1 Tax=Heterorhabditis bacteriophora TaxID=37862 RepID=A0A1I7WQW4_HETBA
MDEHFPLVVSIVDDVVRVQIQTVSYTMLIGSIQRRCYPIHTLLLAKEISYTGTPSAKFQKRKNIFTVHVTWPGVIHTQSNKYYQFQMDLLVVSSSFLFCGTMCGVLGLF